MVSKKRVSKSKKRKVSKREDTDDDLTPKEWQARHDAACAIVARKYCDMFGFWRDCRYKPCRSARRCSGDQGNCLASRWPSVSYEAGVAAQIRMLAETPPNADRFTRAAHHFAHHSICLHIPNNKKARANPAAKSQAQSQATTEVKSQP